MRASEFMIARRNKREISIETLIETLKEQNIGMVVQKIQNRIPAHLQEENETTREGLIMCGLNEAMNNNRQGLVFAITSMREEERNDVVSFINSL